MALGAALQRLECTHSDLTTPDPIGNAPEVLGSAGTCDLGCLGSTGSAADGAAPKAAPGSAEPGRGRPDFVTIRTAARAIFYLSMGIAAVAMGLIAFALGYDLHPM